MEEKCQGGRGNLSDDRGVGCAPDTHLRAAQPSINHNLLVSLAHGSGQKDVDANARSYSYSHHEQLDGESQPKRCQSFLAGFPHVG